MPAASSETADSRPAPASSPPHQCPLRFSARRTGVQGQSPNPLFPRFLVVTSPIPRRSLCFAVERRNDRTLASDRGSYANRGHEACEVHSDDGRRRQSQEVYRQQGKAPGSGCTDSLGTPSGAPRQLPRRGSLIPVFHAPQGHSCPQAIHFAQRKFTRRSGAIHSIPRQRDIKCTSKAQTAWLSHLRLLVQMCK